MPKQPNIVWVFADQMRGHAMSCAGDPNVRTPNLDRLAADGVRCVNACATYPVCVPFRFTLLTGEYAHSRWVPALDWRMSPCERTIAHDLDEAGYDTVYIGKWHLNGSIPPGDAQGINRTPIQPGCRGGFREWHGFNLRNGFFDTCCFHGDDPTPVPLGKYQTDGLFDIGVDWLEQRVAEATDTPFFMVLSLEAPHPPHEAPEEFLERVRRRGITPRPNCSTSPPDDGPEYPRGACMWKEHFMSRTVGYCAQVENLDANMGRLMDAVAGSALARNTVVFFFSDHGELLGSHGLISKQDPREESINIPFIVHGPCAGLLGGRLLHEPICTEDIFPTTLALAEVEPPTPKPGLDLLPYLQGGETTLPRRGVYLEFVEEHRPHALFYRTPWRGIRTRRYTYTVLKGKPWQLFDLQEDPYQMENRIARPELVELRRELHAELKRLAVATQDSYTFEDE